MRCHRPPSARVPVERSGRVRLIAMSRLAIGSRAKFDSRCVRSLNSPRVGPGDGPTSFRIEGVRGSNPLSSTLSSTTHAPGPVCLPSNRSAGLDPHLTPEPDVISRQSTLLASTEWHRFDAADGVKETRLCSPAMTVHLRWDAWPSTVSRRGPRQAGTGSRTPRRRRASKIASVRCAWTHSASVTGQASHA